MTRRLVKRLSEVRTAPSGVMVTHFTGQNLAHMGPKKPVRESLSIPRPARKNEIAGQTLYCADFLRLVHDEMLSAARASFAGWLCT
jgi:hypothetical protein